MDRGQEFQAMATQLLKKDAWCSNITFEILIAIRESWID